MRNRCKTVSIEPAWKYPLSVTDLESHPPQGYRFIVSPSLGESCFRWASRFDWAYDFQAWLGTRIPLTLVKSRLEGFRRPSSEAHLTYALIHLVFRQEPWVLDMQCEPPHMLVSMRGSEGQEHRYAEQVRKVLAAPWCKKVICWTEAGRNAFLSWLGWELQEKVEVVPWGVPRRDFVKHYDDGKVKLLFVNSGNINTTAHLNRKGGSEVFQAFLELNRRYGNLELVVRSGVPGDLKRKYEALDNIRILDKPVPWEELEQEWKSADIFVLPTRVTPAHVFLDAMSYELPVVTTDVWGNPDLVEDGRTGLLVPYLRASEYIHDWIPYFDSRYEDTFRAPDRELVKGLVDRLSLLIENPELRRKMGRAARQEVDEGRFSIDKRNEKLKRILDEATS